MAYDAAEKSGVPDDELLRLVGEERRRSIGFDNDSELIASRERALNYYKGEMPDVVAPPNRSQVVSTDIADAVETILPDLVEIFTGGDDVAAFIPQGQEDEEQAQQETDYVLHVIFNENDGWLAFYTMFKDALLLKTGLIKFWWEDTEETEDLEAVDPMQLMLAQQDGEIIEASPSEEQPGTVDATIRRKGGKLCLKAVPPDDFTVASNTVSLKDADYCAFRSRPRAQDLIADGIDPDIVADLPGYTIPNDQINRARDTADESSQPQDGGSGPMRLVEVHEHYIRVLEGSKTCLYRVLTNADETILIDKEKIDSIPIAAITPYIITHRFHGESVADKLAELQKIGTALTRGHMDSMYFALNQRLEVAMDQATEWTLSDILRNEPGLPIRTRTGDAVRAIQAGGPGFDALQSLEHFQTKVEQRTGIVRAAQGLTPDTLHETARGALALLTQAQKRTRLIARIFAETGIKDLFLGVHALLRKHATQQATVRLRGKWVPVSPTSWGQRTDMTIEIGLGASGKEHEFQVLNALADRMQGIIALQGGVEGPLVTVQNAYNLYKRMVEKSGTKAPELFVTDPSTQPPPQPKPNPEMMKVQGQMQLEQVKAQSQLQLEHAKAQAQGVADVRKAQGDAEIARYKADLDAQIKREQIAGELQLKREQLGAELALKRELAMMGLNSANPSPVHPGGEPG
jgi:hypothetical protein